MINTKDPDRLVRVIGPVYRDAQGNVRGSYKERLMPYKSATSEHVRALGVTLVEEIAEGFTPDPRKNYTQVALEKAQKENAELMLELAELKKAKAKEGAKEIKTEANSKKTPVENGGN